jgi:cyclic beta-1,2-glucan synthetase
MKAMHIEYPESWTVSAGSSPERFENEARMALEKVQFENKEAGISLDGVKDANAELTADLKTALETAGWDGEWYRRAYFDDGSPLGSASNPECQIDSIAQSWSVLSGAGDADRSRLAMNALDQRLVRRDHALVQLLEPPFDSSDLDPGYIRGYVPGVRENGGQYTHAAVWTVMATAQLGNGNEAVELFHMLNPINHTRTPRDVERYKAEPFVLAADVYTHAPHVGRGGWTWYTGSAAWMHRLGLESILGVRQRGAHLTVAPCIAASWAGFAVRWRHGTSRYRITVENPDHVERGVAHASLDGVPVDAARIPLLDDGAEHEVRVVMGAPPARAPRSRRELAQTQGPGGASFAGE